MRGRTAVAAVLGGLAFAPAAHAQDFSLSHSHSGQLDATAQGNVAFPATTGGATVNVTITDRRQDGWCAQAWITSNLPPATHTSHRVCGVAEQRTWTLNLPAGQRCNVAFVEVQVGRIDPSEGNKVELGQSIRLANPCPPLPPPAPPATPPPPARITSPVTNLWTVKRGRTRSTKFLVRDLPAGATVKLHCRGRGCPKKTRALKVKNGKASARKVLRRRHLRPGARLELSITAPNMIGKFLRFTVRKRDIPRMTTYCLPPGVRKPQRC